MIRRLYCGHLRGQAGKGRQMPSPDQIRIITVAAFVLLMLFGVRRPVYMVAAYMVLVYCKLSNYYPVFAQIRAESLFAVVILLRVAAAGSLFSNLSFKTSAINKYLFWFVLCVALSFAVAWDHQYSWDHAVYHLIKTLVLYVMIVGAINSKEDLKIFVWAFIFMFAYLAYEPTFYYLSGTGGSRQAYGTNYIAEIGLLSGHVALANNVNQMIPIVAFLFFGSSKRWQKIALASCFLVFFIALVGSGSRGGVVGMLVWASCIVWFSEKRVKMAVIACILLGVLLIGYGSSLISTASRISPSSTQGRLVGLTHGIGMLRNGNVIGVGPGCYLFARQKYFNYRMESHNLYGQVIGDLGLPGMIVFVLFIRELFREIAKVKNKAKNLDNRNEQKQFYYYLMLGLQVSLITRLTISLASHGLYFFYWYVIASLIVVSQRMIKDEETSIDNKANQGEVSSSHKVV